MLTGTQESINQIKIKIGYCSGLQIQLKSRKDGFQIYDVFQNVYFATFYVYVFLKMSTWLDFPFLFHIFIRRIMVIHESIL